MMVLLFRLLYPILIYLGFVDLFSILFNFESLQAMVLAAVIAIPILFYFFYRDEKSRGKERLDFSFQYSIVYLIGIGIASCLSGNGLVFLLETLKELQGFDQVAEVLYGPNLFVQVLSVGLLFPVVEELLFRGLIYARIRDQKSFLFSAIVSSLIFAIFHGNIQQGIYGFYIGFILAFVYERYRSFIAPCLLHIIVNLLSIMITAIDQPVLTFLLTNPVSVLFEGVIIIILIYVLNKKNKEE